VTSRATRRFWVAYRELPVEIRGLAKKTYTLFRENPAHPSLHFKRIHAIEPIYSVRIARGYRALGLLEGDEITWFWVGSHAGYDRLLASM
jgi:hypothetical protein